MRGEPRPLRDLVHEALRLETPDDDGEALGFFARALVQATLPHSDPGTNEFVRRNGFYSLSMLAPSDVGLPYGRYPRLLVAYLATEAVRRRTRLLELDDRFPDFCSRLGVVPTSGPRGTMTLVREQAQRLFASSFQCVYQSPGEGHHAGDGFVVAEKRALWWDPLRPEAGLRRGSFVTLSERFFDEVRAAPVPLDLRVLRALRSPLPRREAGGDARRAGAAPLRPSRVAATSPVPAERHRGRSSAGTMRPTDRRGEHVGEPAMCDA